MQAKMMFDLQAPTDANYNKHNILCGTRNDLLVALPAIAVAANATAVTTFLHYKPLIFV